MVEYPDLTGFWFHGTVSPVAFGEWIIPPPVIRDEGVGNHTAVFLAKDRSWASQPGGKKLCRAQLTTCARVLDLRTGSEATEVLRKHLLDIEVGKPWRHTQQLRTKEAWEAAWRTGDAMRFQPAGFQREKFDKLHAQAMAAVNASRTLHAGQHVRPSDLKAAIEIQKLTRVWIEAICGSAKSLGFSVLAGREPDRTSSGLEWARDILAVFEPQSLTPPVWEM